MLVNLWKHPSCHNAEVGPLLQQIDDLSRCFVDFSLVFSSRTCNKLAHECAKLVPRDRSVEWLVPPALRGIADNDCNHVHDE